MMVEMRVQLQQLVVDMANIQILQSTFSVSTMRKLISAISDVNWKESKESIMQQIQEVSPPQYLWAIGSSPAYFVQYQVNSAAILKILGHIIIVWKPKFIEYPTIIQFPELKDKKLNSLKFQYINNTTTERTTEMMTDFVEKFYGTYFHSDSDFDTNLVTYAKHFVSKTTNHSYWHALLEDTGKLFVTNRKQFDSVVQIRLSGVKEGYDKTLLLFSYKGMRDSWFLTARSKWMQVLSFLGMLVIFYAIVACPSDATEGICVYKQQMTLSGAGIMMALMGIRFTQKGNKKKKTSAMGNPEAQKRD